MGQKQKILIVDNDPFLVHLYTRRMREFGMEVVSVRAGKEVVGAIRSHRPNAVIMDVNLPDKDGLSVVAELRDNKETPKIPIVFLTNSWEKRHRHGASRLGVRDYLLKSEVTSEEVAFKIQKLFS